MALPEIFPQLSHSLSYRDSIYVNLGVVTIEGSLPLGSRYYRELLTDVKFCHYFLAVFTCGTLQYSGTPI